MTAEEKREKRKTWRKQHLQKRQEAGLCSCCPNRITKGSRCEACKKAQRDAQKKLAADRKAKKLCKSCGRRPPEGTSVRCSKCKHRHRKSADKRIEARIAAGVCIICEDAVDTGIMCEACKAAKRAVLEDRKASGECVVCQTPTDGVSCDACKKVRRDRTAERKAKGLCTKCGIEPVKPGYTRCGICRATLRFLAKRDQEVIEINLSRPDQRIIYLSESVDNVEAA